MILEIKPEKQTKEPKNKKTKSYKMDMSTYLVNEAKWLAANKLCKDNEWEFKILTEKNIFNEYK